MRIGAEIARDVVRAVAVDGRSGRVRAASEAVVGPEGTAAALGTALAGLPHRRLLRPGLVVAVGPSACQLKQLTGTPDVGRRVLSAIVRENASRFFLRNGAPLATGDSWTGPEGRQWAAAFDEPVVNLVREACRAARMRLVALVPAVAVLGCTTACEEAEWGDGEVVVSGRFAGGRLTETRRRLAASTEPALPVAVAQLETVGARFAAAYGAALVTADGAPMLRIRRSRLTEPMSVRRRVAALGAAAMAVVAAIVGPVLSSRRIEVAARRELAAIAPTARAASARQAELARFDAALREVAGFSRARQVRSRLLAELAQTLPDSSALVSLRADSATVHLVIVTRRTQPVIAALERAALLTGPEILGPVTRERAGDRELERVTVRLRLRSVP